MNQTSSSDINATLIESFLSDPSSPFGNGTFDNDSSTDNATIDYEYIDAFVEPDFGDMPEILRRYDNFHYAIHGYLCLVTIILGTVGNVISMVVFTRKNMATAINIILAALAFSDTLVLLGYLPKIKYHTDTKWFSYTEVTYAQAVFSMYVKHFFLLGHTLSVWLTVVVAVWRVMGVCYSLTTAHLRSPTRARIAIVSTVVACTLVCLPEFLRYQVGTVLNEDGTEKHRVENSKMYDNNVPLFNFLDDWVFNIALYLFPCIPLTGFTAALLRKLIRAKKKRAKLNVQSASQDKANDRLTTILIIILIIFLVVKLPPGIMYFLEYCLDYEIFHQIHWIFAGTINFFILFNSAINFFVYFFMSTQFRKTAHDVFCKTVVKKVQTMRRGAPPPVPPKPKNQNITTVQVVTEM